MISSLDLLLVALAAVAAGAINAIGGGGTLITFPMLLAIGISPISANVTNTIALCPGFIGGILGQFKDLAGQGRRFRLFLCASAVGGTVGSILLFSSGERLFMSLVPYLILVASCLIALQGVLGKRLVHRTVMMDAATGSETKAVILVGIIAIYGGYFGVAMSVVILALLGLMINDSLTRLNAIKQTIAFGANGAAACLFIFSGKVVWLIALVMAVGALVGGVLGGRLAGHIKPDTLRWTVVSIGFVLAVIYFVS
ncbi:MAG TPA: sulfite exporter TauE/SafE family protein [Acidobacteriota bacterium]|nr:sulfite exporter TauE/SafE family protein [Acidobacteriota bacterium]